MAHRKKIIKGPSDCGAGLLVASESLKADTISKGVICFPWCLAGLRDSSHDQWASVVAEHGDKAMWRAWISWNFVSLTNVL